MGVETAHGHSELGGFTGQKRELCGWKIPSADLFPFGLKAVNTNKGESVDLLLGFQLLTACRCSQYVCPFTFWSLSAYLRLLVPLTQKQILRGVG